MGQILLLPIYRKSPICFQLMYLHLTFTHSKGQNQGHTNFDCISHKLRQIGQVSLLPLHRKSPIGFRLVSIHLTLVHSKYQGQGHSQFDCEKFEKTESCCILPYRSVYADLSCFLHRSNGVVRCILAGHVNMNAYICMSQNV